MTQTLSPEIRLLHLAIEGVEDVGARDPSLAALAARHADGLARVRRLMRLEDFTGPRDAAGIAAMFERLAAEDADVAVAAYSFGDPGLLAAFTEEVARVACDWADCRGDVLDFGCGAGRVAGALVARARSVTGVDVATGMVARARAAVPGAKFLVGDGVALPVGDAAFDLVLACDSFPFLAQAGVVPGALAECARVLRPGGRLLVFNWTYGDAGLIDGWVAGSPLALVRGPERPFARWDATAYLLGHR